MPGAANVGRVVVVVENNRIDGRVEVVAEVEPQRTDWRFVAYAGADVVAEDVEVACAFGDAGDDLACGGIGLAEVADAGPYLDGWERYCRANPTMSDWTTN